MNKRRLARQRARWLIRTLQFDQPMQIADIGARQMKKPPPYQLLLELEVAHLTGFEPDPEACKILEDTAPAHAKYINKAVGKPGPATFYSHHIGSLSSIFKISAKAARYLGKGFWAQRKIEEVAITLVSLDEIDSMPKLDVLKMDIQGAELDVLKGGTQTLSDAVMIIPEVRFYQMYEKEPMWADLDILMRENGFVLHSFVHQKSVRLPSRVSKSLKMNAGTQLLDGDAVYIPSLEDPDKLSDEQLKRLALAADVITVSHDLCLLCLSILVDRAVLGDNVLDDYLTHLPPDVLMVDSTDKDVSE